MLKKYDRSQEVVENKGPWLSLFRKTNWFWGGKSALFGQKTLLFDL
jgi:hypothetical protein